MGFPRRRWSEYKDLPYFSICNGQWCEDEESVQLIGNALSMHGKTFHVAGGNQGHWPATGSIEDRDLVVTPEQSAEILTLPLKHIYTGTGRRIRIWVEAARADAGSTAFVRAVIGRNSAKTYITAGAGTHGWYLLEVEVPPVESPMLATDAVLYLYCGVDWDDGEGNDETITVRSISVNEAYRIGAEVDRWKDTTGANNKLGDPDYPFSTGAMRVLAGNAHATYQHRTSRSNLFQHSYRQNHKYYLTSNYDADEAGLGTWAVRKGWNVDQLDGLYHAWGAYTGTWTQDDIDVKIGLWSFDSVAYDGQTAAFTAGTWVTGQTSGARGLILKIDNVVGLTGDLLLCYVSGDFTDNETLVDDDGGQALANGTNAGPALVDYDEQTCAAANSWYSWDIDSLIDHEAEYILRADAKASAESSADIAQMMVIWAAEHQGADNDTVLPNALHTEQDDDVVGTEWTRIRDLLSEIYNHRRQVVLQDFLLSDSGSVISRTTDYFKVVSTAMTDWAFAFAGTVPYDNEKGVLDCGPLFASKHSRYLVARVWVRRVGGDSFRRLDFDNGAGANPVPDEGLTITGGTSGATAEVYHVESVGVAGTMSIRNINGAFLDNEQITFTGGTADVDGAMYQFEARPQLQLAIYRDETADTWLESCVVDCSRLSRDKATLVELRVPISPEWWDDKTIDGTDHQPYLWIVNSKTTDQADYLILDKDVVFEEPVLPGGWNVSGDDDAVPPVAPVLADWGDGLPDEDDGTDIWGDGLP